MAQDITLLNAQYSAVPAVLLPKTGGGTAQFDDTTDATASASEVINGYTAYVNGSKVTGTHKLQPNRVVSRSAGASDNVYEITPGSGYESGSMLKVTLTVPGDANLVAGNIKSGVEIFGVTGTYSGGATNFVSGTFTTQSTTASVQSITIPYTGTGYPIAGLVYIDGGVYNSSSTYGGNTTWYNSTQRYAVGEWAFTKSRVPQTPDWGTSGSGNAGVIAVIYKNSTSSGTSYSRTSAMSVVVLTSNAPTSTATEVIKFSDNKTMKVYIASTSYGLIASTKYAYHIIYSS